MILYFSGTGNSQYGAKVIGEILKEQIDSINSYMKKDMFPTFQSDTPYVIVMPVYAWKIPRVVETFLKRCTFKGNRKMYFVITCGENIGSADVYAEKLCLEIGMEYGGTSDIPMPENFIAMFQVPPEQKCKEMMESARRCV